MAAAAAAAAAAAGSLWTILSDPVFLRCGRVDALNENGVDLGQTHLFIVEMGLGGEGGNSLRVQLSIKGVGGADSGTPLQIGTRVSSAREAVDWSFFYNKSNNLREFTNKCGVGNTSFIQNIQEIPRPSFFKFYICFFIDPLSGWSDYKMLPVNLTN